MCFQLVDFQETYEDNDPDSSSTLQRWPEFELPAA